MKLVRYGQPGKEKPGLIDAAGKLRDLSKVIADVTPDHLSDKALAKLAKLNTDKLPLVIARPGIVVGHGGPLQHWGIGRWHGAGPTNFPNSVPYPPPRSGYRAHGWSKPPRCRQGGLQRVCYNNNIVPKGFRLPNAYGLLRP